MKRLVDYLEGNLEEYDIEYRVHASRRMFQRSIYPNEIEAILSNGNVIEQYCNDLPLPSLLLNGKTPKGRPLHVVVAMNMSERKLVIITTYEPDSSQWTDNFTRRL
jgi:hypothetical protein